jgi:hypothetical protein
MDGEAVADHAPGYRSREDRIEKINMAAEDQIPSCLYATSMMCTLYEALHESNAIDVPAITQYDFQEIV